MIIEDMVSCAGVENVFNDCEEYASLECHGCGCALCLKCKHHHSQCEDLLFLYGETTHG